MTEEEPQTSLEEAEEYEKGYRAGKITVTLTTIPRLLGWNPDDGTPPRNDWQRGFLVGWRECTQKGNP